MKLSFEYKLLIVMSMCCPLTLAAQLTMKEFKEVKSYLEKEIVKKYPSDQEDEYSDYVTQVSKSNFTEYHRGDPQQPVFFSVIKGQVGTKVVVIERGADYLLPEDKDTFVVLRQRSGGKDYNVHIALILELGKYYKIVLWQDARIEQLGRSAAVLNVMASPHMPKRMSTDMRPRCAWVSESVLFCDAKKSVVGYKRKYPPPFPAGPPPTKPAQSDDADDAPGAVEESKGDAGDGEEKTQEGGDTDSEAGDKLSVTDTVDGDASGSDGDKGSKGSSDTDKTSENSENGGTESTSGDGGQEGGDGNAEKYIRVKGAEGEAKGRGVKGKGRSGGGRKESVPFNTRGKH